MRQAHSRPFSSKRLEMHDNPKASKKAMHAMSLLRSRLSLSQLKLRHKPPISPLSNELPHSDEAKASRVN